jgi:hypothetical protein
MRVIIILALIAPTFLQAQDLDSLKAKILAIEQTQTHMQIELSAAHKEFRTGTIVMIAGVIVSSLELLKPSRGDSGEPRPKPILGYIGVGMITIGGAIQIHSHRHIGRAGRRAGRKQ